ncbi:MAG TPA: hypothetical protein VMU16_11245 [Candidatus Binataceae bacterium]|nr:hypothetical protein [Candidatus Binataceae bacterium]
MKRIGTALIAIALLLAKVPPAIACANCYAASSPRTLLAFYLSTILLTTMPFALIAAFVMYIRRHRLGSPSNPPPG